MNLIGPTCQNSANDADVPLFWNGIDIDWVVGCHLCGHPFLQDDDAGGLIDVQGHLSIVFVHTGALDAHDASRSQVGMRPPILVIPAGSLTVLFPRIVLQHPEGDLLFFASNHLITNVVRDDSNLNLDVSIVARQFREAGDFLGFSRGACATGWGWRCAALEASKHRTHGILRRNVEFLFVLGKSLGNFLGIGLRAFFLNGLDIVCVLVFRHHVVLRQALLFGACTENRRRAFVRVG